MNKIDHLSDIDLAEQIAQLPLEERLRFFENLKNDCANDYIYQQEGEEHTVQMNSTPASLCNQMVAKIQEVISDLSQRRVLVYNYEFLPFFDGTKADILFFADNLLKRNAVRIAFPHYSVEYGNFLSWESDMNFDVIVGNPPYQPNVRKGSGGSGSRNTIWDKFVHVALDRLAPNGALCFVHPPKWRKPFDKLGKRMFQLQFHHLEMYSKQEGDRTFNATTPYDWYVLLNRPVTRPTVVRGWNGVTTAIDLKNCHFFPNFDFDLLRKLMAQPGDTTPEVLFGNHYETRKSHMNMGKTARFRHPCVHWTGKKEPFVKYWYSSKRGQFFDVPKLIFSDADCIASAVVDVRGEFGLTQHAIGLRIKSKREGEQMKKALESPRFYQFLLACRWSQWQIDWRLFKCLKKDFWKEFL